MWYKFCLLLLLTVLTMMPLGAMEGTFQDEKDVIKGEDYCKVPTLLYFAANVYVANQLTSELKNVHGENIDDFRENSSLSKLPDCESIQKTIARCLFSNCLKQGWEIRYFKPLDIPERAGGQYFKTLYSFDKKYSIQQIEGRLVLCKDSISLKQIATNYQAKACFSHDNNYIALKGYSTQGNIEIFCNNNDQWSKIQEFQKHTDFSDFAFLNDGQEPILVLAYPDSIQLLNKNDEEFTCFECMDGIKLGYPAIHETSLNQLLIAGLKPLRSSAKYNTLQCLYKKNDRWKLKEQLLEFSEGLMSSDRCTFVVLQKPNQLLQALFMHSPKDGTWSVGKRIDLPESADHLEKFEKGIVTYRDTTPSERGKNYYNGGSVALDIYSLNTVSSIPSYYGPSRELNCEINESFDALLALIAFRQSKTKKHFDALMQSETFLASPGQFKEELRTKCIQKSRKLSLAGPLKHFINENERSLCESIRKTLLILPPLTMTGIYSYIAFKKFQNINTLIKLVPIPFICIGSTILTQGALIIFFDPYTKLHRICHQFSLLKKKLRTADNNNNFKTPIMNRLFPIVDE